MTRIYVTDHAVLRYIERHYSVDLTRIRAEIENKAGAAAKLGAKSVSVGDLKFELSPDREGTVVIKTVLERWMKQKFRPPRKKNRHKEVEL